MGGQGKVQELVGAVTRVAMAAAEFNTPKEPIQTFVGGNPNVRGYSARNLWRMMPFFEIYRDQPKLSPLVTELPWTHNLLIMSRCKRDDEREFYLRLATREK